LTAQTAGRPWLSQANPAPAIVAARVFANQIHARTIERIDDLDQRVDDTADVARRGFHPLDGRQGHAGQFGQGFLIYPEQRSRSPHLERRDHSGLT
jgi:hypothetical protein